MALEQPALRWSGPAYFDTNDGDAPLEQDFARWNWCRAPLPGGGAGVLYNVEPRDGGARSLALRVQPMGGSRDGAATAASLPPTRLWRMPRPFRAEPGAAPTVLRTLEDTPFYARSVVSTRMLGAPAQAVHESLSLDRFRAPVVQAMLPFRVPAPGDDAPPRRRLPCAAIRISPLTTSHGALARGGTKRLHSARQRLAMELGR